MNFPEFFTVPIAVQIDKLKENCLTILLIKLEVFCLFVPRLWPDREIAQVISIKVFRRRHFYVVLVNIWRHGEMQPENKL